jgi:hypothetical protein
MHEIPSSATDSISSDLAFWEVERTPAPNVQTLAPDSLDFILKRRFRVEARQAKTLPLSICNGAKTTGQSLIWLARRGMFGPFQYLTG